MTAVDAILVLFALRISCLNVCEGTGEDTILTVNGTIVNTAENEETFMLICTTNKKPLQCSIEFLHNNSTIESLRNSYDGCYDKYGKCQSVVCSCSDDCLSFQWNFTTSSVKVNDSLGCHIRIYNSTYKSSYKVFALVLYNGTDFTSVTSIKQTIAKTTHSPSKKRNFGSLSCSVDHSGFHKFGRNIYLSRICISSHAKREENKFFVAK